MAVAKFIYSSYIKQTAMSHELNRKGKLLAETPPPKEEKEKKLNVNDDYNDYEIHETDDVDDQDW